MTLTFELVGALTSIPVAFRLTLSARPSSEPEIPIPKENPRARNSCGKPGAATPALMFTAQTASHVQAGS